MFSYAKSLINISDPLQSISLDQLYGKIKYPDSDVSFLIKQLRIMRGVDPNGYRNRKRNLPYFVCAKFNPPFRRTENFAYLEYFVVDVDNISEKGFSLDPLKSKLITDKRVALCFKSPSEDGLKLVFKLKQRCYDAGVYPVFYKAFVKDFSGQYSLQQVVDSSICDVARACFLSWDSDAYLNTNPDCIDISAYVNTESSLDFFTKKKELDRDVVEDEPVEIHFSDPDTEALRKIKSLLNPNARLEKLKAPVFIPEILNRIIEGLKNHIESTGIVVNEISDIQYGKKLKCSLGLKVSETNLFYGKKGFSVVQSPKKGTDKELNETIAQLVENGIVHYCEQGTF